MSYNGSGTFVINTAGQPVVSGTVISSTAFNALTADLATGLSTAITKDGQTTPTANIPMGNNKITGLAVGTAATDAANLSQVQSTAAKLVGSVSGVDTITGTMSPTLAAYAAGQMFYFVAAGDNTGAVTLNLDGLGAKAVTRDGSVALAAGDIKSGEVVVVVYDGTRFQVVSQLNSAGNATFANVSITSALNVGGVATFSGGTANGVLYLNGSKVATSGSALVFDGSGKLALGNVAHTSFIPTTALTLGNSAANAEIRMGQQDTSALISKWVYNATVGNAYGAIETYGQTNYIQFGASDFRWQVASSEQMRLTSTGLGIGTSSVNAGYRGQFEGNSAAAAISVGVRNNNTTGITRFTLGNDIGLARFTVGYTGSTASAPFGASLGYIGTEGAEPIVFQTDGTERMRLSAAGNLGLGVTPSAWASNYKSFQLGSVSSVADTGTATRLTSNGWVNSSGTNIYLTTAAATTYIQSAGQHLWYNAPSGTAGNAITFTQAMVLDASGNLGVGTTSPGERLDVRSGGLGVGNGTIKTVISYTTEGLVGTTSNHALLLYANNAERARITSEGIFLVGKTSASLASAGVSIEGNGTTSCTVSGAQVLVANRNTNDGTIVSLRQDQTEEGTISVSGNTVSYNAFAGSHWSQLQDGSRPDILRGTVMESINELCEWPNEQNERLPKAKISDTAGSKKVYGVFMAWDNDWIKTNDMYVTAVGAFICRVNGSVMVQEGDLLESNGDGTARVQTDDIIRSSTIGKVTSTVKTHEYDDGSYCVPTVLYCG